MALDRLTHSLDNDLVPRSLVDEAGDEIRSTKKTLKYKSFDCTLFCCKARRKQLKHEGVFLLTSEVFLPFPACFTTKQSTVSRLLYLFHDKESVKFPMHHFVIFKTNFWQMVRHLQLRVLYSHKARICDQTECALFLDFIRNQHISLAT